MTDHKFEPFQRVLVRTFHGKWKCEIFSNYDYKEDKPFECAGGKYRECIPYTPETAHLLGTSQPYEPSKPPVEYEWGQKVEVRSGDYWLQGLYIGKANESYAHHIIINTQVKASVHDERNIRPLTDTAANADD